MCVWFKLQQEQLDAILTTAVETSALGLITGCIKQWSTEGEHSSSLIRIGVQFYSVFTDLFIYVLLRFLSSSL